MDEETGRQTIIETLKKKKGKTGRKTPKKFWGSGGQQQTFFPGEMPGLGGAAEFGQASALIAQQQQADALSQSYANLTKNTEAYGRALSDAADNQFLERQQALNDIVKETNENLVSVGVGAVQMLASSMWDAADAALAAGASWQQALGGILKATLLSTAKTATVEALKNVAYALHATGLTFLPGGQAAAGGAASFWASAAKWAAVAAATGAAGLALSAGGVGATGGGSGSGSSSRGGSFGAGFAAFKSAGQAQQRADYTINIQNYFGDPGNPSARIMEMKKLQTETKLVANM